MAYYEPQGWQAPMRQASWDQPAPPSRSGTSSTAPRDENLNAAFSSQFDEVDRAIDNLVKSGKLFNMIPRRDSVPVMVGRPYAEYDPRMGGIPPRHHSISDYESVRPHSASNVQGFYAAQRYQARPNEADQMMQAKRRMAAQRERELRNYHQEQQYNRSLLSEMSGSKSERSLSPAAMTEESRRDLIARQHRALYGNESPFFPNGSLPSDDHHNARADNQTAATPTTTAPGARGPSPRGDPFGLGQNQGQGPSEGAGQGPPGAAIGPSPVAPQPRSRSNSTSSPSTGAKPSGFNVYDSNPNQQQTHTSSSSPIGGTSGSPANRQPGSKPSATAVGPIGSRPAQQQAGANQANATFGKGSTTASLSSPLGYGFTPNNEVNNTFAANSNYLGNERSSSSASNPATASATVAPGSGVKDATNSMGMGWATGSGVWRSKNSLGVQASVWG
ncbi:hypothetical protein AJ80_09507 [Polytolypa hystricis UAMH7299]|uniref:Uncharacterized protein n=1 Tax=Polytolypa hystricis (strain UAMH7299) TaxID=1447883 RepID=A0A2B7WPU5_POLH7|nr:hypothetical protein AJ80_09507 [Polytolypa hystricis UAMH7299]